VNLAHLGTPVAPMTRVHGKSSNRMWRLETDQGLFSVKELRQDRGWFYRHDDVFRLEQIAFAAGIPMPEPVSADREVLVHRWVEGEPVPEVPVPPSFAFEVGEILAHLHALDIGRTQAPVELPMPTDWPELAARAVASRQRWADELVAVVDDFLAISQFAARCERRGPVVVTHRDVAPWNLLDDGGHPVVLDWELAGPLELSSELGSTALNLATWGGDGAGDSEHAVFRAVLDGYVTGGGTLPEPGPDWFVYMVSGWAQFTHWNVVRCLAGGEGPTDPDLALAQEELLNGLRGLPTLYARLPELEELLVGR
jgi:aminoglycoside phosphotransferase (APT) family kinase protein